MTIAMTIATTIRMPHSMTARFGLRFDRGAAASSAAAAARSPPPGPGPSLAPDPFPDGGGAVPAGGADDGGGFDVVGHRGCSTTPSSQIRRAESDAGARSTRSTSCRTGAGVGPPPSAPSSASSGGATTVASGPRATQQPFEPRRLADGQHDLARPRPRRASPTRAGWLSTTHSAAGASRSVTRGRRARGRYTRSRGRRRRRVTPGRSARPSARTARTRSTRNSRSPSRAVAPRGDVPGAERVEHPPRVDDAGGHLVACEGVVVDLDALVVGCPRPAVAASWSLAPTSTARLPGAPSASSSFAERGGQRTVVVGTGHREQRTSRGEQREALGRREAQRSFEVLGEADLDLAVDHRHVDEPVRGVRRQAAHRQQLEVAFELALGHLEPRRELGDRDAGVGQDPRHQCEHALQPRSDERAARGAPPCARPPCARDRVEPRDHVDAQLGRRQDLGVIEQVDDPRPERGAVHDREGDDDRAVGPAIHAPPPRRAGRPPSRRAGRRPARARRRAGPRRR